MSEAQEGLRHELEAAQCALAEAEARLANQEAEYQSASKEAEKVRKQVIQAHQEWMDAVDTLEAPIFIHDQEFRVLRCNRAYQQSAGVPHKQIIGQPYYEVFPKIHAPLPSCLQALEAAAEEEEEEVTVGDTTYCSRAYSVRDGQGNYLYSIHTLENINESKRVMEELLESEQQYRWLFESATDGILILDAETGVIVDANPFILDLLSYSLSECTGKMLWEIGPFRNIVPSKAAFRELQSQGYIRYEDLPLETKDGRQIDVEFISNVYVVGERKVIQCNIRDISEGILAKQLLQESELQYRQLFEAAQDGILILDAETGKIVDANPFILKLLSYSLDECKGKMLWEIGLFKDVEASRVAFNELKSTGYVRYDHLPLETKDGRRIEVEFVSNLYLVGEQNVIQCNIRDISEARRINELFFASRDLLSNIVENTPIRVFWKDSELRYLGCNTAFALDAGMSCPDDLIGKDDFQLGWHEQAELNRIDDQQVMDGGIPKLGYEEQLSTSDGEVVWVRTSKVPLRTIDGKVFAILGIYEDITERKHSEEGLRRANRALKTLWAGNRALVQATSEEGLLQAITKVIVEQGGYAQVVVDYAKDDPGKSITPMAWPDCEKSLYCVEQPSWDDTDHGQMPISLAIISGKTQICHDIASDPSSKTLRESAKARNYISNIALPLSDGERTFGGLSIYTSDPDAFVEEKELLLLEELANDLAYGIVALRTRIEHEQHTAILRQSLEQSIQTIAATVEARDPYTAGHQRRVAELATAIAQEMGLPEDQVNGIHLAAIVHDLGKIQIPAEILSKPGKLTDIEFMLIKEHPQNGYNILKDVKFPWPIADIILQHHERINGSGYPQGLEDEQIQLEPRILAVADVVEAMSSHRPYRASMGVEAALEEVERGRGSMYDPAVADACLKLFAEKEFAFSGQSS